MRRYDLASTLFLMVLAGYVTASGFRLGFGVWREPGPGFLAVLTGVVLGLLAAVWFGMTLAMRWGTCKARPFFAGPGAVRKLMLTVTGLCAFPLLLGPLGFPLTTLAFLIFFLRAIGARRWGFTLGVSILTTVFCVIVFQLWLQAQFPDGPVSVHELRKWAF